MIRIDISKKNPYDAVADTIRNFYGFTTGETLVVRLKTGNLGVDTVLLMPTEFGTYEWDTDWYEGGDVDLIGYIPLNKISIPEIVEIKFK